MKRKETFHLYRSKRGATNISRAIVIQISLDQFCHFTPTVVLSTVCFLLNLHHHRYHHFSSYLLRCDLTLEMIQRKYLRLVISWSTFASFCLLSFSFEQLNQQCFDLLVVLTQLLTMLVDYFLQICFCAFYQRLSMTIRQMTFAWPDSNQHHRYCQCFCCWGFVAVAFYASFHHFEFHSFHCSCPCHSVHFQPPTTTGAGVAFRPFSAVFLSFSLLFLTAPDNLPCGLGIVPDMCPSTR